jgi:uncharacterized protein (TIGR04255 family)
MEKFNSPDFPNAPLVEVALSIQFQPLVNFSSAHAGEFWQLLKTEFPTTQDEQPLPQINEYFGGNRPFPPSLEFGISIGHPGTRTFFLSQDGDYLVQVQRNRFALNWRKTSSKPEYPRYEVVRSKLEKYFLMFRKYADVAGLGSLQVDLFEAHYVNRWPLDDGKSYGEVIGDWLKLLSNDVTSLKMEQASISTQYLITGKSMQPTGRLYLNLNPAVNQLGKFGVNLELICRTLPFEDGALAEFSPLDLAREKIVTTFEQITSDSAHKFWRGTT